MKLQVRFSSDALRDLHEIREFIAQDSPGAADAMIRQIQSATAYLASFPKMGKQTTLLSVRRLVVRPYLIFYQFESDHIFVVSVVHGMTREASQL